MSSAKRRRSSDGFIISCLALCVVWAGGSTSAATPGNAWFVLTPAPAAGDFDADDYLSDPDRWPALSEDHSRGWSIAYRSQNPPDGWERPFVLRGGGAARGGDGVLRSSFAGGLAEMLSARGAAILALLDPPDSAACSPGKPNPHPFLRDGWLGLHDGRLDIVETTMQVWRADVGPGWPEFKAGHPRDYHAKGDSTRGNAGEIAFLMFLHQRERAGGNIPTSIGATIRCFLDLPSFAESQLNFVLQSSDTTWILRYAPAREEEYCVFYGRTTNGEYWVADHLPGGAGEWHALANRALACFPSTGSVTIFDLAPSEVRADDDHDSYSNDQPELRLRAVSPCLSEIRLVFSWPPTTRATLEILDPSGRRLLRRTLSEVPAEWVWRPPASLPAGLYWARLQAEGGEAGTRILRLR